MKILVSLCAFLLSITSCGATTICWSGTEIAADSQSTSGHLKYKSASPKLVRSDKRHATLAAAGMVMITNPIKKYFLETDKPLSEYELPEIALKTEGSFALFIVYDDGTAEYYTHLMTDPQPVVAPFAMGSGEEIALAALVCGKTAAEAIEIAKELDLYTGGKVHVLTAPVLEIKMDVTMPSLELPKTITL